MKKLIIAAITATVVIIVLAGCLMPVMEDATATTKTFENSGAFDMAKFESSDTYSLIYDKTTETITVNGYEVTPIAGITASSNVSYSILATDNLLLRYGANGSATYMQVVGMDSSDAAILSGSGSYLTATITDGNLVVTYTAADNTTVTKTITFTELYSVVSSDDTAVMKVSTDSAYILGDSEVYASGLTSVSNWSNMFHFEGTYDDGITITSPNLAGCTFDNIVWNIEPVDGYEDLYKLTSIEFDIIYNDTTTHATYSYFVVPSDVTAEKSVHFTDSENAILGIVPVMLIIALLVAIVALVIRNREM